MKRSSAAIIDAVSHSPRMICRPIVASSIHGTGAQKWRANLPRGWIGSSTTAFGPNSARSDAAWVDDRPASSDGPRAAVSCKLSPYGYRFKPDPRLFGFLASADRRRHVCEVSGGSEVKPNAEIVEFSRIEKQPRANSRLRYLADAGMFVLRPRPDASLFRVP